MLSSWREVICNVNEAHTREQEVVGGIGAVASIFQQSLDLLDRVQMALDRQKHYAMHLSVVARDVEGTQGIVKRIKNNPMLQNDDLAASAKQLLDIATRLNSLVDELEAKSNKEKNGGFRAFAHNFVQGPKEQKQLEQLRSDLVGSKNTLILGIVAELAPSGTSLTVKNTESLNISYMQNGRIARNESDKDVDHLLIENVKSRDASTMINTLITAPQHDKLVTASNQKFRITQLMDLMKQQYIEPDMKAQIFQIIQAELAKPMD